MVVGNIIFKNLVEIRYMFEILVLGLLKDVSDKFIKDVVSINLIEWLLVIEVKFNLIKIELELVNYNIILMY